LLPALAGTAAAAPPLAGPRCEEERAKKAFSSAMDRYMRRGWKEATPWLEEAAAVCPVLDWKYRPKIFLEFPYLPFYYLGNCQYNLENLPDALRSFYLASCFGEPAREPESTEDLQTLTQGVRTKLRKQKRPPSNPYFMDGFAASHQNDWQETAAKMWAALQVWEEDGTITHDSAGRWPTPYLPRYRLAAALFRLGCYREACDQLDRSKLNQIRPPGSEEEAKEMKALKVQCVQKLSAAYPDPAICGQWRCFLKAERP
jgi:tetratricopeptide (TPR) repeat protein